jgi:two-component system, NarL family, invasion response regulator UvrY
MIRILIVDDHPVVREGYRRLLERQPGMVVAGEAAAAADAYQAYRQANPDVVIMDLSLQGPGGIEAIRHIRQWDKGARILVFTMHRSAAFATKAFAAGAQGYVTKSSPPAVLVRAVAEVAQGRPTLSDDIAQDLALARLDQEADPLAALSAREFEILRLLLAGRDVAAIAQALCLSPKTVRNHHYQIKSKLGAATDIELVLVALRAGILPDDTERDRA